MTSPNSSQVCWSEIPLMWEKMTSFSVVFRMKISNFWCLVPTMKLFAYNVKTDAVEWKVLKMGKILDVTCVTIDGHSYLFACFCRSESIEMFSASDGRYLGCLIKVEDQDLGRPWRVEWCEKKSSLIVAQDTYYNWIVSAIKLKF